MENSVSEDSEIEAGDGKEAVTEKKSLVFAIAFDGVIVEDAYPGIGDEVYRATDVIRRLQGAGHFCVLWSSRTGTKLVEAIMWLMDHGIIMDAVNINPTPTPLMGNPKMVADVYLESRSFPMFPGWEDVLDYYLGGAPDDAPFVPTNHTLTDELQGVFNAGQYNESVSGNGSTAAGNTTSPETVPEGGNGPGQAEPDNK